MSAQLNDDFQDGDFSNNPSWIGDTGEFIIENQVLRSQGPSASAVLHLSTANSRINATEWRFLIDLPFPPSASNQVRVYLVADQSDLEADLQGYYIELGQSGDDFIRFFRQDGSSSALLFTGSTAFSGNIRVRIRVFRDNAGNWQLEADPTGGESFASEGAAFNDNTYTTNAFFGVVCEHTSSRNDDFFFDDFYIGDEIVDNISPILDAIEVLSANQVRLSFSESINATSGENTGNYSANNGLANPQNAQINPGNSQQIDLTFATNFSDGLENTLLVQNLQDGAGNLIDPNPSQINFTYFAPFEAGFRDVVINEIMADPNPPVNLANAEYIELFNAGGQAVDLNNWSLSGAILPSFLLAPNTFLILCDEGDESLFNAFGSVIGLSDWNTISNSGEEISLLDQNGATIDRLEFNLTWYQDSQRDDGGYSLEQINPNLPCNNQSNWIASNSSQGGTPGQQNSVFSDAPDNQEPSVISISILDSDQLLLIFSESMDESSLINTGNYSIDNGISISGVNTNSPENTQVTLDLNPSLSEGINYSLNLANIADCSGNLLGINTISFAKGFTPGFNELIFTEIMADPRGDAQPLNPLPEAEFIELFNRGNRVLDLQGLSFSDAGSTISLPQQSLDPGEYLLLCDNSFVTVFQEFGRVLGLANFPDLLNGGEQLTLSDENGNIIFALEYDDSWYQNRSKADGGWTLEIIDTDNPCGEASNWLASEAEIGGTPGSASSVAAIKPDLTAPRLLRAEALDSLHVRLIFNEKMNPAGNGSFNIDNGITVESVSVEAPNFRRINVSLLSPLSRGIQYQVSVQNVADCNGNLIAENNQAPLGLAEPGDSLDIILNELLFNPRTGGNDFVELYNNSDKFINLNNWKLANIDEGVPANQRIITEEDYILPPMGYIVLSADIGNIQSEYPLGNPDVFLEMSSLPSYPDNEGTFLLVNDQGALVERFDYLDDFHFPLLDDDDGVSLERIAFRLPSNDRNSWQSAASTVGFASPGNPNSQVRREDPEDGRVVISPQVFSPDGDGFEDFTTVNLDFEQGGVLVDVIIYDSRGREIRNLANRQLLGSNQATFTWDGTADGQTGARMGYYLVLVRAVQPNGSEEIFRRKVVLGRRF